MYNNRKYAISALAAVLLTGGAVLPAAAQKAPDSDTRIQVAQAARGDEYLPPWQRNSRNAPPAASDDGQPRQITPRRREVPPPGASDYQDRAPVREAARPPYDDSSYSTNEIVDAGHHFFGGLSKGLADVVEYTFQKQGRPNGYILGQEGGGALVVGLRYGEGTLYTKNAGRHPVYWQGPSIGYDAGAEGSKTLILVYNLSDINQIYNRFAGVDGSAYLVGGVGVTFQTYDDVVLAPIRAGVGLRLGANVGYLKYTRSPTWNPF